MAAAPALGIFQTNTAWEYKIQRRGMLLKGVYTLARAPGGQLPGAREAEQREALLMTAVGEPDPVVSHRFLLGGADAAKRRNSATGALPKSDDCEWYARSLEAVSS